ncbi:hypothetical protein C8R46DRAFT_1341754 [Mycena filopes]|nr:hypothetical protein C8R46DRAFT_1341754 [Mycena filopes]
MPHPQYSTLRRSSESLDDDKAHDDEVAEFYKYLSTKADIPAEWLPGAPPAPPPAPPRRPPPGCTAAQAANLPSDWWHSDTNIRIVNGTCDNWSGDHIPFFPDHGPSTTGVAMTQARRRVGIAHSGTPLSSVMDELPFGVLRPMLSIEWPGYCSAWDNSQPLNIEELLQLSESTTLAEVAQQVADYLFNFASLYSQHYDPGAPNGLFIGPGGVTFDRLRLVKLWTVDYGMSWKAEVAVVDDCVDY